MAESKDKKYQKSAVNKVRDSKIIRIIVIVLLLVIAGWMLYSIW